MKKSEFINEVENEIKMLKIHATKEELNKLNFKTFDPCKKNRCIYGQMTGQCNSERAKELIGKCCKIGFDSKKSSRNILDNVCNFTSVKRSITEYNHQVWENYNSRDYYFLSLLEGYIGLKDSKNEHIFDYLIGKTEVLNLK